MCYLEKLVFMSHPTHPDESSALAVADLSWIFLKKKILNAAWSEPEPGLSESQLKLAHSLVMSQMRNQVESGKTRTTK